MKNKITWVNFLHIYQPPWQHRGVIEQIASESYEYLFTLLNKYRNFSCTLNVTGSLVEQLANVRPDLLVKLKKLVDRGQIEITGSSKYHALLPLLNEREIKRQIELNQEVLAQYFDIRQTKGFYFPEMSYSFKAAKVVKKLGFKWIILDAINFQDKIEDDVLYQIKNIGLKVIFRNRKISKAYPAEVIYLKFRKQLKKSETIITATDGEIYGHQHEDWQGHLEKILQNKQLDVLTVGEYLSGIRSKKIIGLRDASWESTEAELRKNIPYALWNHPSNKIHQLLWQMVDLASDLVYKYRRDSNWQWARQHLDRGVSSCTFWWSSAKKPSEFSPLTWNPDMIDNGSEELIRAVRSLKKATSKEKIKAEKLYIDIKKNTWLTHWRKYNK
ncbi:polysaccharide deacetylase family protein [Candidatus Parcubacteria bacterium]|jgi:predicted glycosyl hydrolase (DUF1957 family)|nr:polysaccharide deacetylase family protein [Candidatus Parcubacteria bacterium]